MYREGSAIFLLGEGMERNSNDKNKNQMKNVKKMVKRVKRVKRVKVSCWRFSRVVVVLLVVVVVVSNYWFCDAEMPQGGRCQNDEILVYKTANSNRLLSIKLKSAAN